LRWIEHVKLCPYGFRRTLPCPACGKPLVFTKWASRLATACTLAIVAQVAAMTGFAASPNSCLWYIVPLPTAVVLLAAAFSINVELAAKSDPTPDAASEPTRGAGSSAHQG